MYNTVITHTHTLQGCAVSNADNNPDITHSTSENFSEPREQKEAVNVSGGELVEQPLSDVTWMKTCAG